MSETIFMMALKRIWDPVLSLYAVTNNNSLSDVVGGGLRLLGCRPGARFELGGVISSQIFLINRG